MDYNKCATTLWKFGMFLLLVAIAIPASATFPGKNGRIVFILPPDVYTMKVDASDIRQLTTYTDGTFVDAPAWSADGKEIIFVVVAPPDFIGQLWVMKADGSNRHRLFTDQSGFGDYQPDFSPDGKEVAFTRCKIGGNCAIHRVQADGSGLRAVTPFNANPDVFDIVPRFSPDGRTIAFGSFTRGGILGAIYVVNNDGSGLHRVTPAPVSAVISDWSPDGERLGIDSHCCNPQIPSLFVIGKEGTGLSRITFDQGKLSDDGPSWSPEGDAIVFQRRNLETGMAGIFILRFDGKGETLILERNASMLRPGTKRTFRNRLSKSGQNTVTPVENGGFEPRWGAAQ
jgi:Tol biopolymer transport system component